MSSVPKKRAKWSEQSLDAAILSVRRGQLSQRQASDRYGIPRRTLRNHLLSGTSKKSLGRNAVLTKEQEEDFVSRILKFATIGLPLTPRTIRRQAYVFCTMQNIPNPFNKVSGLAGKEWLKLFLKRNPILSKRKAQFLNPARAQKMNKAIVTDHFEEIRKLYDETGVTDHPERIFNMDEKGCRLTIHHQQVVVTQKGVKRVHMQASEHAENVTVVACVNALGTAIPPMILFKGKRMKPEFNDNLPAGSLVKMAHKGSMTTTLFVDFVHHLAKFKPSGRCVLIFDGASSHLDIRILGAAQKHNIELYCLPSNTTHELQPLDKSVFRSFEHHWDQQLLQYLHEKPDRKLTKSRFNVVLSKVWSKCMTHDNITSGFKTTGLYPFNADAIPEIAFAPSLVTEIPQGNPEKRRDNNSPIPTTSRRRIYSSSSSDDGAYLQPHKTPEKTVTPAIPSNSTNSRHRIYSSSSSDDEAYLQSHKTPKKIVTPEIQLNSTKSPRRIYSSSSSDDETYLQPHKTPEKIGNSIKPKDNNSSTDDERPLSDLKTNSQKSPFQQLLPTPNYAVIKAKPRRKAINYKGQKITMSLFKENKVTKPINKEKDIEKKREKNKKQIKKAKKENKEGEKGAKGWFCHGCKEERLADMRTCKNCKLWYHEECVGLTKQDREDFECPACT